MPVELWRHDWAVPEPSPHRCAVILGGRCVWFPLPTDGTNRERRPLLIHEYGLEDQEPPCRAEGQEGTSRSDVLQLDQWRRVGQARSARAAGLASHRQRPELWRLRAFQPHHGQPQLQQLTATDNAVAVGGSEHGRSLRICGVRKGRSAVRGLTSGVGICVGLSSGDVWLPRMVARQSCC